MFAKTTCCSGIVLAIEEVVIIVDKCCCCFFLADSDGYLLCRWTPYGTATTKCMICKQQVHQDGKYCHTCAYSKGKNQ